MSDDSFPVTPQGHDMMKTELQQLKKVDRVQISREIGAARELGDLSENFEYHAAKDRQGMIEARIRVLESNLAVSQVIDPTTLSGERVVFGATVTLECVETGAERVYRIVGEPEADVAKGWVSVKSPLARVLIGREVGDEVRLPGGKGPHLYEITDVQFV